MEVDGKTICALLTFFLAPQVISQTGSCTRYCAAMANLIPSDQIMAAQCDAVFEASQDFGGINPIVNMFTGDVFQAKKDEFFQTFPSKLAQVCPLPFARSLETVVIVPGVHLTSLPPTGPFFLGDKPYYCDFGMYHMLSNVALVEPSVSPTSFGGWGPTGAGLDSKFSSVTAGIGRA
eukprot:scaffold1265_cov366-Prasinococcus_capsulatus_cf.AAC.24